MLENALMISQIVYNLTLPVFATVSVMVAFKMFTGFKD